jgi:outer membrane lipoprotein SlyB
MKNLALTALVVAALAGCATKESGSGTYKQGETGREQTVRMATVESVRPVSISGNRSGLGTLAGGAVGGIAGSDVGHGKGSAVAAVLGGVVGAIGGEALEERATRHEGVEITVRLENGELRAIVQKAEETFAPGEKVRLLSSGGVTRVTR